MSHKKQTLKMVEEMGKNLEPLMKALKEQKETFDGLINNVPTENDIVRDVQKDLEGLMRDMTPERARKVLDKITKLQNGNEYSSK